MLEFAELLFVLGRELHFLLHGLTRARREHLPKYWRYHLKDKGVDVKRPMVYNDLQI